MPDPIPFLAEFICLVLLGREPIRPRFILVSNSTLADFIRCHDEAFWRIGCDPVNDDPPVSQQMVHTFDAKRNGAVLRKRLDLNA